MSDRKDQDLWLGGIGKEGRRVLWDHRVLLE